MQAVFWKKPMGDTETFKLAQFFYRQWLCSVVVYRVDSVGPILGRIATKSGEASPPNRFRSVQCGWSKEQVVLFRHRLATTSSFFSTEDRNSEQELIIPDDRPHQRPRETGHPLKQTAPLGPEPPNKRKVYDQQHLTLFHKIDQPLTTGFAIKDRLSDQIVPKIQTEYSVPRS